MNMKNIFGAYANLKMTSIYANGFIILFNLKNA